MPRRASATFTAVVVGLVITLAAAGCSSSSTSSSTTTAGSKESFCGLLLAFRASNDTLDAEVNSGDSAAVQAAIQRLVAQSKSLQQQAPAGIAPDAALAASFLAGFDALLAKYSYDIAALSADAEAAEAFTALNTDEVKAALDQLRAYGDTICAVDPTSTTAAAAVADTSTTMGAETSTTLSSG